MLITVSIVTVYQNFFVLKKSIAECLLRQLYENVTKMIKKMQNNESIHIIVFDLRDDTNQMIFQSYTSNDSNNKTLQELVDESENLK